MTKNQVLIRNDSFISIIAQIYNYGHTFLCEVVDFLQVCASVDWSVHPKVPIKGRISNRVRALFIWCAPFIFQLKGYPKKTSFVKILGAIYLGIVSPRRLSFSEFDVLISRPSSEKDGLLGPMVPEQFAPPILKNEGFFWITL